MASSNRHWPSMFKSKPCNNQQWSQYQDTSSSSLLPSNNTSNTTCARSSSITAFPFSSGCEERSPEPKPRWNPKPEQIRILEAIFNSGMVNPPRDEIRRIRAQLLEYGQVGDANVFYWFQNRKSRSKHKQRTLQAKINATALTGNRSGTQNSPSLPASSSSSSSDKASPQTAAATLSGSGGGGGGGGGSSSYGSGSSGNNYNSSSGNVVVDQFGNSPTSVNQPSPYFHPLVPHPHHHHHVPNSNTNTTSTTTTTTTTTCLQDQPLFFPLHQNGATVMGSFSSQQGLCFGTTNTHHDHHYEDHHHPLHQINVDVPHHSDQTVGGFSSLLLGDDEVEKLKFNQHHLSFLVPNPSTASTNSLPSHAYAFPNSLAQILGAGVGDSSVGVAPKSTVYINGMAVEIPVGHLNVKEFGETALLVNTETGEAVPTNEWGVTLHPLHHSASYYLINGSSGSGSGSGSAASLLLHHKHDDDNAVAPGFPYQI